MALCPNEDRLCAVTSDHQLYEVKIINEHIKDSDMKPIISPFHGPGLNAGGITGMDTCVRKPLVATCGMDRTIRVWNIVEQRLDLWKHFQEEPFSLAMHPSGLHIVVGFADKLRLMNLLMDDVRTCHELPVKQCREVKFSDGGSMFSAVNGNVITIFDFNTCDKLADLRGHNSKVLIRIRYGRLVATSRRAKVKAVKVFFQIVSGSPLLHRTMKSLRVLALLPHRFATFIGGGRIKPW